MSKREDWRKLPLITIDPADAKDHDDAVYAEDDPSPDNPGGVIVTVAIADVSWYVRPNSPLDREALKRGNSVYFPDRVVPMLPERIFERPVFAPRRRGPSGDCRAHDLLQGRAQGGAYIPPHHDEECGKALVPAGPSRHRRRAGREDRTAARHDPEAAMACLSHHDDRRDRREPLELDLPERKILLKSDGTVDRVFVPPRLDAHRLIEEMMIQANVAAAETLEKARQPLLYRVHDTPSLAKQEVLREFLGTLEMSLARGNLRSSHFNQILDKARGTPVETMVSEMVLRSQSQAIYSPENLGHFGLNLMKYAHFTSPIRRYSDLIVHRGLVKALNLGEGGLTMEEEEVLDDIAAEISTFERRAMKAERDTVDRLIAHHLAGRIGESFDGRVSGVTKSGLFISLPQFGADGFVPVSTLGMDYFIYDEAHQALTGEKTGLGYRLGDNVEVRLAEAIPLAGSLRFEMLSEGRRMPTGARSFHKSAKKSGRKPVKKPGTRPPRGRR